MTGRKTIATAELHTLLDREFRATWAMGCRDCMVQMPYRVDRDGEDAPNWDMAVRPGCALGCDEVLRRLVERFRNAYDLLPSPDGRASDGGEPAGAVRGCQGIRPHVLSKLVEHIHASLHEPLHVSDLAQQAHLSPFHFARMFRHSLGLPPHAYITARRMDAARELLAASDLPLAEVGRRVGYRTQAHFTGVFRTHVGTTPKQYRDHERRQQLAAAAAVAAPRAPESVQRHPSEQPVAQALEAKDARV